MAQVLNGQDSQGKILALAFSSNLLKILSASFFTRTGTAAGARNLSIIAEGHVLAEGEDRLGVERVLDVHPGRVHLSNSQNILPHG